MEDHYARTHTYYSEYVLTTWMQVAGVKLLLCAVRSNRTSGSTPVSTTTGHRALGP